MLYLATILGTGWNLHEGDLSTGGGQRGQVTPGGALAGFLWNSSGKLEEMIPSLPLKQRLPSREERKGRLHSFSFPLTPTQITTL